MHEEILRSHSLDELLDARLAIIPVAIQYLRPLTTPYLQEVLVPHVLGIIEDANLDLCTDPLEVIADLCSYDEWMTKLSDI